ncbi:uncharacterized protein LOC127704603 [Mytilus californianus]|uniref:uncharacterized protein LOC127704603 n=1 Tax=Mytilus californianus TaxID=6549 RepID=UPI002246D1A7|nr:uncharacterized protein LOC127704603 [Mytilus californianus]
MMSILSTFSLLCNAMFSFSFSISIGQVETLCGDIRDCKVSCSAQHLKYCSDPTRYLQGVCKNTTGGCICQPGRVGSVCQIECDRGYYGHACGKMCDCDNTRCNRATGCPTPGYLTTKFIPPPPVSTNKWTTYKREPTTSFTKNSTTSNINKQPPTTTNRGSMVETSTKNLTLNDGIHETDKSQVQISTQMIIIIIVSTVVGIMVAISICLMVKKYKSNKSITKHIERAQDNSTAQLFSDGTRTRSGNDYEGIDTRFDNTENLQVNSTDEQVVDGYLYVDINLENNRPNAEPNNQPITIDNYTEIRDADLNQSIEENEEVEGSLEQIVNSYSYIDINLEKEPHNVQINDQVLTIDNYMEIRDEDLNQAEEVSLTQSYMSPNDITEIPALFKPDNAYTVVSDLRQITIDLSDVPTIMNKKEEVYNILNRTPKPARHFDTNYDHVTPNDELYNDLNFTLK